jgi:TP901-1 family phage major tail protein
MAKWNENNDLIHGDSLLLYLTSGKTVVAYATSCSLQTDSESIDTSSKFSCKWASAMGGKASYTISADALYCQNDGGISFDKLLEMMVRGEQVEWYIGQEQEFTGACDENPHTLDTEKTYYNGKAVVTSCSLEAGNNEIATCSITLTGAGEIQKDGAQIG